MKRLIVKLRLHKIKLPHRVLHVSHYAHIVMHAIYFGLVMIESGHLYGVAAGALLFLTVLDSIGGGEA